MLLEVDSIMKTFPDQEEPVLDRVSFALDEGERVGIIGRSGGGKTTLARIIAGLERADAGSVTFNGATRDFGSVFLDGGLAVRGEAARADADRASRMHAGRIRAPRSTRQQRVAQHAVWLDMQMVFQNPEASFSDHMTIGDAVWEGAAYKPAFANMTSEARSEKVARTLEIVGLDRSFATKHAFELSGGECQRAAIARAIIGDPKLIICDEATSALDVTVQARIMDLLRHLHADHGMAILFISHDLALVQSFCDRIYSL